MPDVDFDHTFSAPEDRAPAKLPPTPNSTPTLPDSLKPDAVGRVETEARLGRAELINVAFATATFVGGLFCAFYFFNGAELFRTAASWPRELLSARPSYFPSNRAGIFQGAVEEPAGPPVKTSTLDKNGNPFSRVPNFFNDLNSPSASPVSGTENPIGSPVTPPSNPGTPFSSPGGSPSFPPPDSSAPNPDPGSVLDHLG